MWDYRIKAKLESNGRWANKKKINEDKCEKKSFSFSKDCRILVEVAAVEFGIVRCTKNEVFH